MDTGRILALSSIGLVLLGAVLAWFDNFLLPNQMIRAGFPKGFPFIVNGGMWGDLLLISPVLYLIGKYADNWNAGQICIALFFGIAASYTMHHYVYGQGKFPDALASKDRGITLAGWVHVVYFAVAIAIIGLFYFCTHASRSDLLLVGLLLMLHIVVANHIPLNFLNNIYHFSWCSDIFTEESSPLSITFIASMMLLLVTVYKF